MPVDPVYLADAPETSFLSNGWGPGERNQSNGENQPNDGVTISIRGVEYARGLGVHADSVVEYPLNGAWARFQAVIGIDDEVFNFGVVPVTARVRGDGVLLYDSGEVLDTMDGILVDVDVSGYTTLRLEALALGGSFNAAHFDWADARVVAAAFTVEDLAGIATSASSVSAAMIILRSLSGSVEGQSVATAGLRCARTFAGESQGQGVATGALAALRALRGEATGQAAASTWFSLRCRLAGITSGTGAASAWLSLRSRLAGITSGTGATAAGLARIRSLFGETAGASSARAPMVLIRGLRGVAKGVSRLIGLIRQQAGTPWQRTDVVRSSPRTLPVDPEWRLHLVRPEKRVMRAEEG